MKSRTSLYPWGLVASGWVVYGFGISPGYYSWGQFLPATLPDLEMTRGQGGLIFGVFTFFYSCLAPVVAWAIGRFGLRAVMSFGAFLAASGFLVTSRADSFLDCLFGYSILAGAGIGLGTILPTQTLATNWFVRYRATALAIMMTAGGIVGKLVPVLDTWVLENLTWREGWLIIAGVSVAVGLFALAFIRNAPEDVGLLPDGRRSDDEGALPADLLATAPSPASSDWAPGEALRTPQFALLVLCGVAFAVPWGVVVAHGVLHLGDQGFAREIAAGIIGTMVLVSILGRLTGLLGDLIAPQRLLGIALAVEAVGLFGFLGADTRSQALLFALALGLGFGVSYVSISATFAAFFGRKAFAMTAGTRMLITGIFNALMPWVAGWIFDRQGSYTLAFASIATVTALGAAAALLSRPPMRSG